MSVFGRWLWPALAVLALAFYYFSRGHAQMQENMCGAVTAIARDPQKIKYVREWVAERTADRQFMREIVKYHWFQAGFPATKQYIDIDWHYLGMHPQRAWVSFNVNDVSESDEDPARIASVNLNEGRFGVIIKLNSAGNLVGEQGPPGDSSTIRPVSADVSVYCDP